MGSLEPNPYLQCAIRAARAAGDHALAEAHRREEATERTRFDVKLVLDVEAQERAEAVIRREFPDHAILGEERADPLDEGKPTWIIDPIDGTVNFSHGSPYWCSAVSLVHEETTLAGAVYAPVFNELFTATYDGNALLNGQPIRASGVDRMEDAMIHTGFAKNMATDESQHALLRATALQSQKVRLLGAAALDICNVATGRAEGYMDAGIYLWDISAASLIAQRAGATTEILGEIEPGRFLYLCSNGLLHTPLKDLVLTAFDRTAPSMPT